MQKHYHTTLRLWRLLKPFHKHFYLQLFYNSSNQILGIFMTYIMARTLDSLISRDINLLVYLVISYPTVNAIRNFIEYLSINNTSKYLEQMVIQHMQRYSFESIFKLNASQYIEDHSAIKLQVIDRGEAAVEMLLNNILVILLPFSLQITFALLAISLYSIYLSLFCFFTILVSIIWSNKFISYHRQFVRKNIENWDFFRKLRAEAFQHLSLIKVFGVEGNYLKSYLKDRMSMIDYHVKTWESSIYFGFKRNLFLTISMGVTNGLLVLFFLKNFISTGAVYAIWNWTNQLYGNITNIVRTMRQIPLRFIEIEKYLDIIDKKPEFDENGKEKFIAGDIVFKNLTFKYPKSEQNVLENINLTIPYGKKVAFVGTSGSGKSTIIKLLLRIYDFTSGEILVGGKDIRTINSQSLRHNIGYVEQHVDLFDSTIRENILFGLTNEKEKNKISDQKLDEIIHKSRIDQFFHRLSEKGLDTVIGERGVKLSGGERQRIGIARALIKDPSILIFDEATASLDTENEKYIQEAIDESSLGRTSIIIAHRLSTVQNADIIFVIDKGNLAGQGTHFGLLENCEEYKVLVHNQYRNS